MGTKIPIITSAKPLRIPCITVSIINFPDPKVPFAKTIQLQAPWLKLQSGGLINWFLILVGYIPDAKK